MGRGATVLPFPLFSVATLLFAPAMLEGLTRRRRMTAHNKRLRSLALCEKLNSESLFMTRCSHYRAVFIHRSASSPVQNQMSRLGKSGWEHINSVVMRMCEGARIWMNYANRKGMMTQPTILVGNVSAST